MARVRLDEVAADAGVSKATVSMVLNNNPLVAAATRERVQESLRRTGYVYNRAAASLRKQQSNAIGMVVTSLTNPYFAEVVESLQETLDGEGMDVLLGVSAEDPDRQQRLLLNMVGRRVDGIVMVPAQGTDAESIRGLSVPMVLLTRRVEGLDVDYVGGDNLNGSERITQHLINKHGARRLAFFGGVEGSSGRAERLQGFLSAVSTNDLEIQESHQLTCASDRSMARERARVLLEPGGVDAVVCYNDVTALGVLDVAAELGLRVGVDLLVTGFDDIDDAAFAAPPLTSVAVSTRLAGKKAAELLLSGLIGEKRREPQTIILDVELKLRASCGCRSTTERPAAAETAVASS